MKDLKIILKDKYLVMFFAFVLLSGVVSVHYEGSTNTVNPNNDNYELVLYNK